VGLAAYSLRDQMKWNNAKPGKGDMDLLDFLDYCADIQVDAAELTAYYFPNPIEGSYLRELRRRAHLLGLDLSSAAMGNDFSQPPDSDKGKAQFEYTKKWIDTFADLGIPVVRVFGGSSNKGPVDEVYKNMIGNLELALGYAEKRGIILGMENHDRMEDLDFLLKIVHAIDSKWFGVFLDSGNLHDSADPYAQLARIAPYAVSVQAKATVPTNGKHVPSDFNKVIQTLRDGGYAGYVVLEYEEKEDPKTAIPRYIGEIREALKHQPA
jgi:sugar phosphate isomerase/epimerase